MRIRRLFPIAPIATVSLGLRLSQIAAVAAVFTVSATALAEQPDAWTKRKQDEISAMLTRKAPQHEINKAFDGIFDYGTLVKTCWGEHWADLNDGQKAEVTQLMTTIIENNYETNLRKALKFDSQIKSTKPEGDLQRVHIRATDSTNPHAPPVNIEYVLRKEGDGWKAVDIIMEGSRMGHNYHSQIHKMMTNKDQGYSYVVQKLREKAKPKK